jgi:hypothetical protein
VGFINCETRERVLNSEGLSTPQATLEGVIRLKRLQNYAPVTGLAEWTDPAIARA